MPLAEGIEPTSFVKEGGEECLISAYIVVDNEVEIEVDYDDSHHPDLLTIRAETEHNEEKLYEIRDLIGSTSLHSHGESVDFEIDIGEIDYSWEDIGGLDEQKRELRESIVGGVKNPDYFEAANLEVPRGVMMYGPPGTGKTMMARAVAADLQEQIDEDIDVYSANISQLTSMWYGESEKLIEQMFDEAAEAENHSLIILDEIDALLQERTDPMSNEASERMVSVFNSKMDGLEGMEGVTVLGITNIEESIDEAAGRAGRFDLKIEVPKPDREGREHILEIYGDEYELDGEVGLDWLANQTQDYSGAEIEQLMTQANHHAVRRQLDGTELWEDLAPDQADEAVIGKEDFRKAMQEEQDDGLRNREVQ
jgi:transitional endoplasmic reticulum ATPase